MSTYDIFIIDNEGNQHYLKEIPMTFQPQEFLIDHGFNWQYYYIIEERKPTRIEYIYRNNQLLKVNYGN